MTSESGAPFGGHPWTLRLGPGERTAELLPLLSALPLSDLAESRPTIEPLEDLGDLFCEFPESGRLVLDADLLSREEVGLLVRFLERFPGWHLHLLDDDPSGAITRRLLAFDRVDWLPAPADIRAMRALVRPPAGGPPADAHRARPPEERAEAVEAPAEEPEGGEGLAPGVLERVEAILGGGPTPAPPPPAPATPSPSAEPPSAPGEEAGVRETVPPATVPPPTPPAPYFRNQIADLADIVQCVDLSLGQAREAALEGSDPPAPALARQLEDLGGEVARLAHFTRTLSFLAAPPVAGSQRFDLAPMLEEMLTARRAEPNAPRFLFRAVDSLPVRSDKRLLSQAFDALLFLSHHCAGSDGTVRVDARIDERSDARPELLSISIRFPAGPLAELDPQRIVEPYALRRILPELGANSLAAAAGILRGQGGAASLALEPAEGLEWRIHLPLGT